MMLGNISSSLIDSSMVSHWSGLRAFRKSSHCDRFMGIHFNEEWINTITHDVDWPHVCRIYKCDSMRCIWTLPQFRVKVELTRRQKESRQIVTCQSRQDQGRYTSDEH